MHDFSIDPADEGRHEPSDGQFWNESYYMDFHRDDGSLGGYVRAGFYPALGVTWYWACLVGDGRPLVRVVDHESPIPDAPSLDVVGGSLNATHRCEEPCQRFRVGLEARAQVYEDPAQVYYPSQSPDDEQDFALDLVWETDGPGGYQFQYLARYEIPCRVTGQIRVGDETIDFVGHGQRDHSWGARDWWANAWCWNAGRLEDGTRIHSVSARTVDGQPVPFAAGYQQAPGSTLVPIESNSAEEVIDDEGLPTSGRIGVGDLQLSVTPRHFAPVLLEDPNGRLSRFPRCLARYRADDGREGLGWIEWNQPQITTR
jgi:hypothetical protein